MKRVIRFARSASFAGRGLRKAWHEEANFRLEVAAALLVIVAAILLDISQLGIAVLIMTCATVIALELVNTMIELISDVLKPRLDQYIAHIKNLMAAAVAVASLGSIGVAACLLVPPLIRILWQ